MQETRKNGNRQAQEERQAKVAADSAILLSNIFF